jgi:acetyl-CoA C-acetyltransferase
VPQRKGEPLLFSQDEGFRAATTMDSLAKLRVLMPGGTVTAGNASQQNDASAACLIVAEDKLAELGLTPMAALVGWAAAGCEPSHMGIGPVPAVKKLLARLHLTLDDMDLVELNEAFACQVLAVLKGWEWHDQAPSSTSSTSTAPASRWATPLAPPACAFWPRCCTS